jgi:pimeloyl-ACP methyl ester carboxylesterase
MKQLQMFLLLAVFISAVVVSGQQAASRGNAPADIVYAQPGQLVDAGGFRLNLYCMGSGSPTVIFDSGWGDWAPAWSKVQPEIAKWTRACSYDRAGAGFSDPGPMPRTSVHIAEEPTDSASPCRHWRALHSGGKRLRRRQRAHVCGPVHGRGCGAGVG